MTWWVALIPLEVLAGCRGDRPVGADTPVGDVYPVVPACVGCCSSVLNRIINFTGIRLSLTPVPVLVGILMHAQDFLENNS